LFVYKFAVSYFPTFKEVRLSDGLVRVCCLQWSLLSAELMLIFITRIIITAGEVIRGAFLCPTFHKLLAPLMRIMSDEPVCELTLFAFQD
jgi:hypothetical protein